MMKLLAKEEKLEFQTQMAELQDDLMKGPSELKQVRTVVKVEFSAGQPTDHLNPDLFGKVMEELPLKFLNGSRSRAPIKFASRAMVVDMTKERIFSLDKDVLTASINIRLLEVGGWPTQVMPSPSFDFAWASQGHFALLPAVGSATKPEDHVYTTISSKGVEVPLFSGLTVKGTCVVENNYNHTTAYICDPCKPWNKEPRWVPFEKASKADVIPPLEWKKESGSSSSLETSCESPPAPASSESPSSLQTLDSKPSLTSGDRGLMQALEGAVESETSEPREPSEASAIPSAALVSTETPLQPSVPVRPATKGAIVALPPGVRPATARPEREMAALQKLSSSE
ncbi:unnamed protein product [Prorocentrum cordatum]|uniref:Uncharacterized protein n=1 Tax=Prorocentrum cordatum TaxID=2364126 RepID=A0ABN9URX7_9DINO|nr:unnamed protein product [Polarella glacialis]